MQDIQAILEEIREELHDLEDRGKVADYIPQLARIDNRKFAIAVATVDGEVFGVGDQSEPFSIQSISKVFTLTLALGKLGNGLWRRVGREPSGTAFNSIVQLEYEKGIPRNPFINAGAIVVSDIILAGHRPREAIADILRFIRFLSDDPSIMIDPVVAKSETETGFRNAALANYVRAFGNLDHPPELTLGVYFHQCAIAMSCRQLAQAGLFLANGGVNPLTGSNVISRERARRIKRADADLRALRRVRRLRVSCRVAGQKRGSRRNIGNCAGNGRDSGLVAGPGRQRQFAARHVGAGTSRAKSRLERIRCLALTVPGSVLYGLLSTSRSP